MGDETTEEEQAMNRIWILIDALRDKSVRQWLFGRSNDEDVSRLEAVWCRLNGHAGVVYFNIGGLEPDMHCKRCGDYLG